ncbi:MAG TPA: 23S rRNA (pseudouridine(1915)-N(3))-methyltransferase RlmH [Bryobacteraceae bacterium]|nr:23S rRNA (pseudouridine(1915)-N(3))-methyltransferase RlmH [Bryobacteraceae bacterium]
MKVFLYYIGKPRDAHLNALAADYVDRSARYSACEMREIRPERTDPWAKHPAARRILLDPAGKPMDTPAFVAVISQAQMEGRDLVFVVGGADGLPPAWVGRADGLLSLSRMTFPHELARVMLAEQIYRAFATLRGHPYPR